MAIKFLDEEPQSQVEPQGKIRFLDDEPQQVSTLVDTSSQSKPKVRFIDEEPQGQSAAEVVGSYAKGAVGSFADIGYSTLEGFASLIGQSTGDERFARAVSSFRNYADDFYTGDVPADIKDNFSYKATQAIAQIPAFATAAMTGGVGMIPLGANAYQQGRDDYLGTMGVTSENATSEQMAEANKAGAITAIPLMLLEKFGAGKLVSSVFGQTTKLTAKEAAKRISIAAISEGATEGLQTALQNVIASEIQGYDPDREIDQNVLESIALGAIASGAVTAGGNATTASVNRLMGGVQKGEINSSDMADPELGQKFADSIVDQNIAPPVGSSKPAKKYFGSAKEFIKDIIVPISSQMGSISPRLKGALRETEFMIGRMNNVRAEKAKPFIQKLQKLSKTDQTEYNALARELYNGEDADTTVINNILEKHGMADDYKSVRALLDEVYDEASNLGMKGPTGKSQFIGYLEDYFPRSVKDLDGLKNSFSGEVPANQFDRLVKDEEATLGRQLNADERAIMFESFVKGTMRRGVTNQATQFQKERKLRSVGDDQLQYYDKPEASLARYIERMTTAIETKKFLGTNDIYTEDRRERVPGKLGQILNEEFEAGNITDRDVDAAKVLVEARFGPKKLQNEFVKGAKNLGYIATMGNPGSAITQIGDFYFSAYQNGILPTLTNLPKALIGRADIKMSDIGIDKDQVTIEAQEAGGFLNDALNFVFKASGLTKLDRVAKETNINAAYQQAKKKAKADRESGDYKLLRAKLIAMKGVEQADQTIADLRNDVKSDQVLELLFDQISDVAPVSMSEMPPMYASSPNGRMAYMLKSYTIKQLNFIKQESYDRMAKGVSMAANGNKIRGSKEFAGGFKNLMKIAIMATAANASADVLKDIIFDREIDPEDIMWDNLLRLFGISRYTTRIAAEKGPGEAMLKTVLPPQFNILDDIAKDAMGARDIADMRSAKYVPLVGKLYYWKEGRGAEMERKYRFRD